VYSSKKYTNVIPLMGDGYLVDVPDANPFTFRRQFEDSVLIHSAGTDLNQRDTLVEALNELGYKRANQLKKIPKEDLVRQLKYFMILKSVPPEDKKVRSLYVVMKHVGTWHLALREYFSVDLHHQSKFNILLSFIRKSLIVDDLEFINPKYKSDLRMLKRKLDLSNLRSALLKFARSSRSELDVVAFVMGL